MTDPLFPPQLTGVLSSLRSSADAAFPGRWTRCYLLATRHSASHLNTMSPLWIGEERFKKRWLDDQAKMDVPDTLLSWADELAEGGKPVWHIVVIGMNRVPGDYQVKLIYPGDTDDTGWEVDPRHTQPIVDKIVASVPLPEPPPPTHVNQSSRSGWWRRLPGW